MIIKNKMLKVDIKIVKVLVFIGTLTTIIYLSFNFYQPDIKNTMEMNLICPNFLSYEKDSVLNINASTSSEYLESITIALKQDNTQLDLLSIRQYEYKLENIFFEDVVLSLKENEVNKNSRLVISIIARDKYGYESKKYCIYKSFELINNPNE